MHTMEFLPTENRPVFIIIPHVIAYTRGMALYQPVSPRDKAHFEQEQHRRDHLFFFREAKTSIKTNIPTSYNFRVQEK
jgi:hypothetical protein